VAGVAQFRVDRVGVAPVEGGLVGSHEEVSGVGGQSDACNASHHLLLALDDHVAAGNLCDGSVSRAHEQVVVGQKRDNIDSLLEALLGGANLPEELALEVNLNDVAGQCSEEGAGVVSSELHAVVLALDSAGSNVVEGDLLLDQVLGPHADAVVVDGEEPAVVVVEEADLVCNVVADVVAAEGFAGLNLF
jgi:hypothetical protein